MRSHDQNPSKPDVSSGQRHLEKAARLAGPVGKLKAKAATAAWKRLIKPLVGGVAVLSLLMSVAFCGAGSNDAGGGGVPARFTYGEIATPAISFFGPELHRELVRAAAVTGVPSAGGVPWTLAAALLLAASDAGRYSPFDRCDRRPDALATTMNRRDASVQECDETAEKVTSFPVVSPPIADPDTTAVGPFLLVDPPATVDAHSLISNRQLPQDRPTSALDLIVDSLHRVRSDLEAAGFDYDESDPVAVAEFWEAAVSRLAVIGPNSAAGCLTPPVSWGRPASDFASAIDQVWRCELRRGPRLITLTESTSSSRPVSAVVDPTARIDLIVDEALQASWSFSRWGQDASRNRCQGVAGLDGTVIYPAPWEPQGVFPLTEDVFRRFVSDPTVNRCDPAANIAAAVQAFIAGESVFPSSGSGPRGDSRGPWAPVVGGWEAMPWVLGSDIDAFRRSGAHHVDKPGWRPDSGCRTAIDDTLAQLAGELIADQIPVTAATEQVVVDVGLRLARFDEPRRACAPTTEIGWMTAIADRATWWTNPQPAANQVTTTDDETAASRDDTIPPSTVPVENSDPDESSTSPPVDSSTPASPESSTDLNDIDDETRAAIELIGRTVARMIARGEGSMKAEPGRDAQLPRFSYQGRIPSSHPPLVPAVDRYAQRVVALAIDIGGLFPDDPSPRRNPFTVVVEMEPPSGGRCGIPVALADAVAAAQTLVTQRWNERFGTDRTIPADMLWGTLLNESGDLWGRIDRDGWTGTRTVEPPGIADVGGFDDKGRPRRGIVGPFMDWMPDTDGGSMDGDPTGDRAVGATQFMPSTWNGLQQRWNLDANNDGVADPHNVYDAVLGTALMFNELVNRWDGDFDNPEAFQTAMSLYTGWSLNDPDDRQRLDGYLELRRQRLEALQACLAVNLTAAESVAVDELGCPLDAPSNMVLGPAAREGINSICRRSIAAAPSPQAAQAIRWALNQLGTPYSATFRERAGWFDCSSLVARAFESAGVPTRTSGWSPSTFHMVPASGYTAVDWLVDIPAAQVRPGDLYFFNFARRDSDGSLAGHVLIALVDGLVVEASSGHNGVVVRPLSQHFPSRTVIAHKRVTV